MDDVRGDDGDPKIVAEVNEKAASCEEFENFLVVDKISLSAHNVFEAVYDLPSASCEQWCCYDGTVYWIKEYETDITVHTRKIGTVNHNGKDDKEGINWSLAQLSTMLSQLFDPYLVYDALGKKDCVIVCHDAHSIEWFLIESLLEEVKSNAKDWSDKQLAYSIIELMCVKALEVDLEAHVRAHAEENDDVGWHEVVPKIKLIFNNQVIDHGHDNRTQDLSKY